MFKVTIPLYMHNITFLMHFTYSVQNVPLFPSISCSIFSIRYLFSILHVSYHAPGLRVSIPIFAYIHTKNDVFMAFVMRPLLPKCMFTALVDCIT